MAQLVQREGSIVPETNFVVECECALLLSLQKRGVLNQVQCEECIQKLKQQAGNCPKSAGRT